MSIAAQSYFGSLLKEGKLDTLMKQGPIEHLFRQEFDKKIFEFVDSFARQYGKLPQIETVEQNTKAKLIDAPEPANYYLEVLRKSYVEFAIRQAAEAATVHLNGDDKDPLKAFAVLSTALSDIRVKQVAHSMIDYREAGSLLMQAYAKADMAGADDGLKFGWPYMDSMTGGITEGDVISIAATSGMGKTWMLLWMALNAWLQGRPVLFVSMEIKTVPILQRLTAIHTKKSIKAVKEGGMTTSAKKDWLEKLNALPGYPHGFWVVDGALTATIQDVEALALLLKPGLIVIDGAYLAKHPTEKDRYRRVAENADLIKTKLAELAPTIASYQFNREAKKLKKGDKPGLDEIAGSAAVGHNSSIVLALFEEDTAETEKRREVTVVKGRNGENGSFLINWTFSHTTTDFSEAEEETLQNLEF